MVRKFKLLGILLLPLLAIFAIHSPHASADSLNYTDHLIDDYIFRMTTTMSANDIQTFLAGKGSGLASFSDTETCGNDARGAMMAQYASYYSCGTQQKASKIIYDTAQAYGINPQVLLATMQKEQSLVTTPNPTASQLNYAMGYGCPDSGSCSYPGFFTQVAWAAWQLRYDYEAINGNSYGGWSSSAYPCQGSPNHNWSWTDSNGATHYYYYSYPLVTGNNITFWDDYGNAYAQFTLPNASTSSLYCYTPHVYPGSSKEYYSGSYWFVYYFNQWFGNPVGPGYSFLDSIGPQSQILPNDVVSVQVRLTNHSGTTWYSDGNVPAGQHPTRLAMYGYQNNPFANPADPGWLGTQNQVKMVESSVADGSTATFNFTLKGPLQAVSTYAIKFYPVLDGVKVYPYIGMEWDTSTPAPVYGYEVVGSSGFTGNMPTNYSDAASYTIKNTGNVVWFNEVSKPLGAAPLRLLTTNPYYHNSQFYDSSSWLAPNQIAMSTAKVTPGYTGTFTFNLKMPASNGTYSDGFGLVLDGAAVYSDTSQMNFSINVADYSFSVVSSDLPSTLMAGQKYSCKVVLKNTGYATWYSDGNTPANVHAIRLMMAGYKNNPLADLSDSNWLSPNQIKMATASVAPGSNGEFDFSFVAPYNSSGYFTDMRLVLDGVWIVPSPSIAKTTTIPSRTYGYDAVNGTVNPPATMQKGQIASLKLMVKNNTNFVWYSDDAKPSQFKGGGLRIVMTNPWYRSSVFADPADDSAWLGTSSQIKMVTASVAPGQVGEFDFTWKAPTTSGFYRERFAPVLDGYSIFPDIGMEFDTTVQ